MGVAFVDCKIAAPSQQALVNAIFDQNDAIIKTNVISNNFINTNYPSYGNKPYAVQLPYIITVAAIGFTNIPSWPPPFYPYYHEQKSKLVVNKTDTMGNVIWIKEYGGEMNYVGRSIAFTSDGGCVISGTRYDSTMYSPRVSENFLLKLDANGNLNTVGLGKEFSRNGTSIRCYPNPGTDHIYFDVPFEEKIFIEVYNNLGALVLSVGDYKTMTSINISDLKPNLYYYKVQTRLNNYSGKFIKE